MKIADLVDCEAFVFEFLREKQVFRFTLFLDKGGRVRKGEPNTKETEGGFGINRCNCKAFRRKSESKRTRI